MPDDPSRAALDGECGLLLEGVGATWTYRSSRSHERPSALFWVRYAVLLALARTGVKQLAGLSDMRGSSFRLLVLVGLPNGVL